MRGDGDVAGEFLEAVAIGVAEDFFEEGLGFAVAHEQEDVHALVRGGGRVHPRIESGIVVWELADAHEDFASPGGVPEVAHVCREIAGHEVFVR